MVRCCLWLAVLTLLLTPRGVRAQTAELLSTWDTAAVTLAGPDSGEICGWRNLTGGDAPIAGTFHATVSGESNTSILKSTQAGGRVRCAHEAAGSNPYQMTVEMTMVAGEQSLPGSWTDSDGHSGDNPSARPAETLPQAREAPWELLIAAWALLGAALLSRGARRQWASWEGDDAS